MKASKAKIETFGRMKKIDPVLYLSCSVLVLFGILAVYSASSYSAAKNYGTEYYFLYKQISGALLGTGAMIALSFVDYRILGKIRYVLLAIAFLLLIAVLIPGIGVENYGARRWINLPFFTVQASEPAKFAFVVYAAYYMSKHVEKMTSFLGALPVLMTGGAICALIMAEPNMSITVCMALIMLAMLFAGGMRISHFFMIGVPAAVLAVLLIIFEPYRLNRLMAFIDPWASPLDEGFQLLQSFYSLGSGGLFGVGLFRSRQKYLFLPFSESDFILSIIGEEFGFVGCIILMSVYVVMIVRAIKIARTAPDRFGCYLAFGIAVIIAVQVMVNIAVVTGSIPPTGLPLPFISSGSSSLIAFMGGIGILQSVAGARHKSVER